MRERCNRTGSLREFRIGMGGMNSGMGADGRSHQGGDRRKKNQQEIFRSFPVSAIREIGREADYREEDQGERDQSITG